MASFRKKLEPYKSPTETTTEAKRKFTDEAAPLESEFRIKVRILLYWIVPAFVFVLVLGAVSAVGLYLANQEGAFEDGGAIMEAEEAGPLQLDPERFTPQDLLNAYLRETGRVSELVTIQSLRALGEIREIGGEPLEIQVLKKVPNLVHLVIDPEGLAIWFRLRGIQGWGLIDRGSGERVAVELADDQWSSLVSLRNLHDPLRAIALSLENSGRIRTAERANYEGRSSYRIEVQKPEGEAVRLYIDEDSLLLFAKEEEILHRGKRILIRSEYLDYRKIAETGIFLPFHEKVFVDGQFRQDLVFSSIDLNPGIMSSLFDTPATIQKRPE